MQQQQRGGGARPVGEGLKQAKTLAQHAQRQFRRLVARGSVGRSVGCARVGSALVCQPASPPAGLFGRTGRYICCPKIGAHPAGTIPPPFVPSLPPFHFPSCALPVPSRHHPRIPTPSRVTASAPAATACIVLPCAPRPCVRTRGGVVDWLGVHQPPLASHLKYLNPPGTSSSSSSNSSVSSRQRGSAAGIVRPGAAGRCVRPLRLFARAPDWRGLVY